MLNSPIIAPYGSPIINPLGVDYSSLPTENLALWLDAFDYSSLLFGATDRVSQWSDKSSYANHVANATANQRPLYTASAINGKPAIRFGDDGTTKVLTRADNTSFDYLSLSGFCVFRRVTDLGATETLFGKWNTASNKREHRMAVSSTDTIQIQTSTNGAGGGPAANGGALALDTNFIADISWPGSTTISVSLNNNTPGTATLTGGVMFAGDALFTVGAHGSIGERFAGYIGEVLWYRVALAAAQRLQVLRYLSNKWGIAIS